MNMYENTTSETIVMNMYENTTSDLIDSVSPEELRHAKLEDLVNDQLLCLKFIRLMQSRIDAYTSICRKVAYRTASGAGSDMAVLTANELRLYCTLLQEFNADCRTPFSATTLLSLKSWLLQEANVQELKLEADALKHKDIVKANLPQGFVNGPIIRRDNKKVKYKIRKRLHGNKNAKYEMTPLAVAIMQYGNEELLSYLALREMYFLMGNRQRGSLRTNSCTLCGKPFTLIRAFFELTRDMIIVEGLSSLKPLVCMACFKQVKTRHKSNAFSIAVVQQTTEDYKQVPLCFFDDVYQRQQARFDFGIDEALANELYMNPWLKANGYGSNFEVLDVVLHKSHKIAFEILSELRDKYEDYSDIVV